MCKYLGARLQVCDLLALLHVPDVDVALYSCQPWLSKSCLESLTLLLPAIRQLESGATVTLRIGTSSSGIYEGSQLTKAAIVPLTHQLVRAGSATEIPDLDRTRLIAGDELALVWMNDHIVDSCFVIEIALRSLWRPRVPDLQTAIFAARDEPFAFILPCDCCYIGGVALQCSHLRQQ